MSKFLLLVALLLATPIAFAANTAGSVIRYESGTGYASGFTDPLSALGEPARVTPGPFGGPVDPLNPPYLAAQLVSVGAGGSLTVRFNQPFTDDPSHPFGIDFLIFGNAGFVVTNAFDENFNYIGTPATDGSLFAANAGATEVSVSADGETYFRLNPALAPVVDALYPTDGNGDFEVAVDPALATSFGGATLAQIRSLYGGAGGGTGFDLAWAQDASGQSVSLPGVQYVRVDVLSGKSEIDAFVAVPEPATALLALAGAVLALGLRRADGGL